VRRHQRQGSGGTRAVASAAHMRRSPAAGAGPRAGGRARVRPASLALVLASCFGVAGAVPIQSDDMARGGSLSAARMLTQKVNYCCIAVCV